MISCLIFTKDNADRVIHLIKLVEKYVSEVVVICSDWECKRRIKYACPNTFLHYEEPRGYVEAYYKKGISICHNDWILMLDDDETPSDNLLKSLLDFREYEDPISSVYLIKRFEKNGDTCYIPRFFHKDAVIVTGLIHRGIKPISPPLKLIGICYLAHNSEYSKEKSERFAKIEAAQYPQIIGDAAENSKALQLFYFFVSTFKRVLTAPNKKDTLIYCWHLLKELRK